MTYSRMGMEQLSDLMPLCSDHHKELHAHINSSGNKLYEGSLWWVAKQIAPWISKYRDREKYVLTIIRYGEINPQKVNTKAHRKGIYHDRSKAKIETTQERKKTKYGTNTNRPNREGMKPKTHPHTILVTDEIWDLLRSAKGSMTWEEFIKGLLAYASQKN